mmetsp:Transcript_3512/g.10790  ORF Transcript_3512/g.10790 Transcript_3512/m.10790 type:complete len:230 (-) Transcript_3512:345-1034(-)
MFLDFLCISNSSSISSFASFTFFQSIFVLSNTLIFFDFSILAINASKPLIFCPFRFSFSSASLASFEPSLYVFSTSMTIPAKSLFSITAFKPSCSLILCTFLDVFAAFMASLASFILSSTSFSSSSSSSWGSPSFVFFFFFAAGRLSFFCADDVEEEDNNPERILSELSGFSSASLCRSFNLYASSVGDIRRNDALVALCIVSDRGVVVFAFRFFPVAGFFFFFAFPVV